MCSFKNQSASGITLIVEKRLLARTCVCETLVYLCPLLSRPSLLYGSLCVADIHHLSWLVGLVVF